MSKRLTDLEKMAIERLILKRIADFESLYPDSTWFLNGPRPQKAFKCMALLGAVLKVTGRRDIQGSERIIRWISNLCYRHQYQGKWKQVQDLLENVLDFSDYRSYITSEIMSPNDYYGNLEKLIYCYLRLLEPKTEGANYGKIRRPQRKRGYNDKGNLRPSWMKRKVAVPDDREDRRPLVLHPLVGEIRQNYDYHLDWRQTNSEGSNDRITPERKEGGEGHAHLG